MGCCCSSLKFRDVYEDMKNKFQLTEKNAYTNSPPRKCIAERTEVFQKILDYSSKQRSKVDKPSIAHPFSCEHKPITLNALSRYGDKVWELPVVFPLNSYLLFRSTRLVCEFGGPVTGDATLDLATPELFRCHFRLWMLCMCEFYHVLAVLQETKTFPKPAKKWLKKMSKHKAVFFAASQSGNGKLLPEAEEAIAEGYLVSMSIKDLTSNLIAHLDGEMPTLFSSNHGPGPTMKSKSAQSIFSQVVNYWEATTKHTSGAAAVTRNPLSCNSLVIPFAGFVEWVALRYALSFSGSEEDPDAYLPKLTAYEECLPTLFDFEECLPTLYATLECGPRYYAYEEMEPTLYSYEELLPTLFAWHECEPTLYANEECEPSLFAFEECWPTLFAYEECEPFLPTLYASEVCEPLDADANATDCLTDGLGGAGDIDGNMLLVQLTAYEECGPSIFAYDELLPTLFAEEECPPEKFEFSLDALRLMLRRLKQLEEELADESLSPELRLEKEMEKADIEDTLQMLFRRLSRGTFRLSAQDARDGMYVLFNLHTIFPNKQVHDRLSDIAFASALDSDDTYIVNLSEFRHYLEAYICLLDLYEDAIAQDESANFGDVVQPLQESQFMGVARGASSRDESFLAAVPLASEDDTNLDVTKEKIEVLFEFFSRCDLSETGDPQKLVHFDDICVYAVSEKIPVLLDLHVLKMRLGIDCEPNAKRIAVVKEILRNSSPPPVFGGETADEKEKRVISLICASLERKVTLSNFSYSSGFAAIEGLKFSALSLRFLSSPFDDQPPCTRWRSIIDSTFATEEQSGDAAPIEQSSSYALTGFFGYATFCSTAVLRTLGETKTSYHPGRNRKELTVPIDLKTRIDFDWFQRAARGCADALGIPADILFLDVGEILQRRIPDAHNEDLQPQPLEIDAGVRISEKASPSYPKPDASVSVLERAFWSFADANSKRDGTSRPLVNVDDLIYVCLMRYTKSKYSDHPLFKEFFKNLGTTAAERENEAAESIKRLKLIFPFSDESRLYREFFTFSKGHRSVLTDPNGADDFGADEFAHNMFVYYQDYLEPLFSKESEFIDVFRLAATFVAHGKGGINVRDFRAVLGYIVGHLTVVSTYLCSFHPSDPHDPVSVAEMSPVLVEKLLRNLMDEDLLDNVGDDKLRNAFNAFLRDHHHATISCAAEWYGEFCATKLPLTLGEKWGTIAKKLPYTCSREHRQTRREIFEEIRRAIVETRTKSEKSAKVNDGSSSDDDDSDDDYLSTASIADILRQRYKLDKIVHQLIEQHKIVLLRGSSHGEQSVDDEGDQWITWLRDIVFRTNTLLNRRDLGSREIHRRDFRFLLEYIQVYLSTFFGSEYGRKEVEGILDAQEWAWITTYKQLLELEQTQPEVLPIPQRCTFGHDLYRKSYLRILKALHATKTVVGRAEELLQCLANGLEYTGVPSALLGASTAKGLSSEYDGLASGQHGYPVDSDQIAHLTAALFVQYSKAVNRKAEDLFRDQEDDRLAGMLLQRLQDGLADLFPPGIPYWQQLRLLLPHTNTEMKRKLRAHIFSRMDAENKGYLKAAGINDVFLNNLHLNNYRDDFLPVLFRSFFAVQEMSYSSQDTIYLTAKGKERLIREKELSAFFGYMYRFMELYYMFDTLSCCRRVGSDLHVVAANDVEDAAEVVKKASGESFSHAAAIEKLASTPANLMLEAAGVNKEVTFKQFYSARRLLKKWGVSARNTQEVYSWISRRCSQGHNILFTRFSIWASELQLHPEGYGYGIEDDNDAVAVIEANLLKSDR